MYLCKDEGAYLLHDGYLAGRYENAKSGQSAQTESFVAFGDTFIFKVVPRSEETGEPKQAKNIAMGEDFVLRVRHKGWVIGMMLLLLMYGLITEEK